ncbi:MAG TPA: GNAT family N-acetyltransferase [Candidatus Eisenbacteria bacterium]
MDVRFAANAPVNGEDLNALFSAAWPDHRSRDFGPVLARSLTYVCAFAGDRLVGFVNLAWDGGAHAFLLDPTVHPEFRRQGIGSGIVNKAVSECRERGVEWVHVDYEPALAVFYRRCGFRSTSAGLIRLAGPRALR